MILSHDLPTLSFFWTWFSFMFFAGSKSGCGLLQVRINDMSNEGCAVRLGWAQSLGEWLTRLHVPLKFPSNASCLPVPCSSS